MTPRPIGFPRPARRFPAGVLALAACAACLTLQPAPARAAFLDAQQTVRILTDGGWYQEVIYNFSTGAFAGMTDPINFNAAVSYTLIVDQWIGVFHYDYTAGAYTEALYQHNDVQ